MRIDKVKVYKFDELSEEAQEKAIEQLADVNVDCDWWESTYEDAAEVGIKLTEFDIGRGSYCRGNFTLDAEDVAKKIIDQHGACCPTHETATTFLAEFSRCKTEFERTDEYDPEYEEFKDNRLYDGMANEFRCLILEDYRIILEQEYGNLTGSEAIIETIKSNEYEFKEDGTQY